ncbi:uncharacterized protein SPPG_01494 [Spizellomyces punctatus DAOM BR117]|uniref:Ribosomal protein L7Ae/L30e/S12e/Gadd45 domain-containing protein n=1 Tax=Spizellomyces punctatus (strain DAOM BR117) TaxID=645134 RepID=A0A0L0HT47_SPIPD|nr:uncharacterized protein SPPG_01494 [Spizellomyces punctatus DAOM BR117]KND04049.1 hypothetical protein SPPG_01494 [Spizellomyces punctatus DAOM BR117]|eukprot:XP_016612088.1 hypothetical protein SPPG_01494 [Spizellomyces punctatus DAOM BR117]
MNSPRPQRKSTPTSHARALTQEALIADEENVLRDKTRRTVFKHVFDSPFQFEWPALSTEDNEEILQALCRILTSVGEHRRGQCERRKEDIVHKIIARKQSRAAILAAAVKPATQDVPQTLDELEAAKKKKKKRKGMSGGAIEIPEMLPKQPPNPPSDTGIGALAALQDIVLGINKVTRILEDSCTTAQASTASQLRLVFLCSGDVPVSHLYAHIPTLTYLAGNNVLLCPFAKGAEAALATALGIKRLTILGIRNDTPRFDDLCALVASRISPPNIPWLQRPSNAIPGTTRSTARSASYYPLRIKTVKTSAPITQKKNGRTPKLQHAQRQNAAAGPIGNSKGLISTKERDNAGG